VISFFINNGMASTPKSTFVGYGNWLCSCLLLYFSLMPPFKKSLGMNAAIPGFAWETNDSEGPKEAVESTGLPPASPPHPEPHLPL
jgi:hypothetical protein